MNFGKEVLASLTPWTLRQILKTVLSGTQSGPLVVDKLKEELNVTGDAVEDALSHLQEEGLVTINEGSIELTRDNRLRLAVKAIELGADFQTVSQSLGWLEFEELAAHIFEMNGYSVHRRFRFQAEGRRWEIDVLALRSPYIVCAECKHWTKGIGNSTARGIIETHLEKTEVFSRHLNQLAKKIRAQRWSQATVVPVTLTLTPTDMNIYRRVPCVSILTLPSFLDEFGGQLERLAYHRVELPPWKPKPTQTRLRPS
jgi:Holliday junction resolvase-like predicted endonuclease